jgi:hypothetical protein
MAKKRKQIPYFNSEDESDSGSRNDGNDKGEGTSGPPGGPHPPKRPRLSHLPGVPDEQSPAANKDNIPKFLFSLSKEHSYDTLIHQALLLPGPVSPFYFFIRMDLSNYCYMQDLFRILFLGQEFKNQFTSLGVLGLDRKVSSR